MGDGSAYRRFFENVPVGLYRSTPDGRLLDVNPAFVSLLGYPDAESLRAVNVGDLYADPEDRLRWRAIVEREGVARRVQIRLRRHDGAVILVESTGAAVRDDEGDVACYEGVVEDVTQREQAEAARRASEAMYRALVEQIPAATYVASPDGLHTLYISPQIEGMLGFPPVEWTTRSDLWTRQLHPEDRARVLGEMDAAVASGAPFRSEYRIHARDGRVVWIRDEATVVRDDAGRPLAIQGVLSDVTERRQAEAHRGRLIALLEATPDFVAIADRERRPIYLNRAGRAMLGIGAAEDVSTIPFVEMIAPSAAGLILDEAIPEAIRKGVWSGEALLRRRDGHAVPVSQVLLAHKGPGGDLEFLSTIARDVSERKRADEMIRRQSEFSQRLIDSSVDGIVAFDRECRFTIWNTTMERVTGVGEADALGRNASEVLPFLRETGDDRYFLDALAGRTLVARDRAYRLPDGRRGLFEGHFSPLKDESDRVVGGLAIIRDVTDRQRLEDELRHAQKLEAVGRLAGGVAHDFSNLLTVISGCTELLLLGLPTDDPRRPHAQEVMNAADRAAALTQQLLAFSRRQVLQPELLNLNAVVGDMRSLLRRLVGDRVEIALEAGHALGMVRADPSQIQQVVLNLAVNARDAMPGGGRIVISTGNVELRDEDVRPRVNVEPGRYVTLSVADGGVGMDPATKQKIFEPFFTTKDRGTGLGLATVYGIVSQSGGHLDVESEPGHGSTFRIYLPRVDAPPRGAGRQVEEGMGGHETLLVVEDEDGVRDLARLILTAYGYSVLDARNGDDALRIGERQDRPIDLLLSDVVLPDVSGPELAEALGRRRPGLLVIYMSGFDPDVARTHGVPARGAVLLKKPFTSEVLVRAVRQALDRPRAGA